jgi:1-acyl-sn-glycerol-3-phosphate acyltransferase
MIGTLVAAAIRLLARFITAVTADWRPHLPDDRPRIFFANHASHGDFVLVWSVLPERIRRHTRPVAGADYWERGPIRRFIGKSVFDAVLVERDAAKRTEDAIDPMLRAIDGGSSLILFPEGTRNLTDAPILPFKSGLYRVAAARPGIELVPAWIANLNRALPKGELIPVPILCTVTFGLPIRLRRGEEKEAFLERAQNALLSLRPKESSRP